MHSFELLDFIILIGFFAALLIIGLYVKRVNETDSENYLLSGRNLSLPLFIFTSVSTWYGGILGVGEFSYRYGIASWFTQGLPYYLFAIIFAFFFAKKIREAALVTIPDKLKNTFGESTAMLGAVLIMFLVSPAPYILMIAVILKYLFAVPIWLGLIVALLISISYLLKGGYRSDIITDVFLFFVMFIGFAITLFFLYKNFGGTALLAANLPEKHFELRGNLSWFQVFVWYLIALWTIADPGFHQRTNAAKDSSVAVKGILFSVILWFAFDFLTTSVGLYSRALVPKLDNAVFAYPALADNFLVEGIRGLFFAGLFATIISTSNSVFFLSGTTLGKDILPFFIKNFENRIVLSTRIGLVIASVVSFLIAIQFESIVEIWYVIGSICIPGLIILIFHAYYPILKCDTKNANRILIFSPLFSFVWFYLKEEKILTSSLNSIEPMIVGIICGLLLYLLFGSRLKKKETHS